jgi:dihydrolipoamide dehydrogenase
MLARKDGVVKKLTGGVSQLLKANKVAFYHGTGRLGAGRAVSVAPSGGGETIELQADNVILASGSVPLRIPNVEFDGEYIVDNVGALDFDHVPKTLGVIGARFPARPSTRTASCPMTAPCVSVQCPRRSA